MGLLKKLRQAVRGVSVGVVGLVRKPKRGAANAASSQAAFNSAQINYSTPITYKAAVPVKPGLGARISTKEGAATVMRNSTLFRRRQGL